MPMISDTTYRTCLETMFSLRRFGIKLGLSTIRGILEGLGNPQDRYRSIHVAGTNGKGSIAASLAMILRKSGYRVGLYTSPHLVRFNERICVDGRPIDDEAVVSAYRTVRSAWTGDREPTFFECTTAMALHEFARRGVQWAVIETGMGGRLDATSIVRPTACVISNISLEHKSYLGSTIGAIAGEKGGIIKPGIPVVTGVRQKTAIAVIREIAAAAGAPLYRLGEHFRFRKAANGAFNYYGISHTWRNLHPGLIGAFQVENAALTAALCEVLMPTRASAVTEQTVRAGISEVSWPGRIEVVSRRPMVILDGAHNLAAAGTLAAYLAQKLAGRRLTMVVGILDDKPYTAMLKRMLAQCSRVIITRPVIDRALEPARLAEAARLLVPETVIVDRVEKAVAYALETSAEDDVICIAGSLYVVGEAKAWLETHPIGTGDGRE